MQATGVREADRKSIEKKAVVNEDQTVQSSSVNPRAGSHGISPVGCGVGNV